MSLVLHHNNSVTVSQPNSNNIFCSIQMRERRKKNGNNHPFAIMWAVHRYDTDDTDKNETTKNIHNEPKCNVRK